MKQEMYTSQIKNAPPPGPENNLLSFSLKQISSHLMQATIKSKAPIIEEIYNHTINLYKKEITAPGFSTAPISYLEHNYKHDIEQSLKNFLLHYIVLNFMNNMILEEKTPYTNHPRLMDMKISSDNTAKFIFNISIASPIEIREWKYFPFKTPRRKNYKDLDKQVSLFLKRKQSIAKKHPTNVVEQSDWVCFDAVLVDQNQKAILNNFKNNNFWIKIATQSFSSPFVKLLSAKKLGAVLLAENLSFSEEFDDHIIGKYNFLITIKSIVKGASFSLGDFKTTFKLKNKSEIHEKLIEVFSYRNDISQRKTIIEEMFHLFLSKHRFEIPKHLVLRKQEDILLTLKKRPDYQVYKLQKNFVNQVGQLAEKILKEEILIDQIANHENIKIETRDIKNYLNLFTSERLKEFVYFKPIIDIFEESASPVPESIIKQYCRREKTLNHVLHHLMK